jgi:hypothetical protein
MFSNFTQLKAIFNAPKILPKLNLLQNSPSDQFHRKSQKKANDLYQTNSEPTKIREVSQSRQFFASGANPFPECRTHENMSRLVTQKNMFEKHFGTLGLKEQSHLRLVEQKENQLAN